MSAENSLLSPITSRFTLNDLTPKPNCINCDELMTPVIIQHVFSDGEVTIPIENIPALRCTSAESCGTFIPPQVGIDLEMRKIISLANAGFSEKAQYYGDALLKRTSHGISPAAKRFLIVETQAAVSEPPLP